MYGDSRVGKVDGRLRAMSGVFHVTMYQTVHVTIVNRRFTYKIRPPLGFRIPK